MSEGFARNIRTIFGPGDLYRDLANRKLESVELIEDGEKFRINFEEGKPAVFWVDGDCCSHSWIEHLEAPESVKGRTLEKVADYRFATSADDPELAKDVEYDDYVQAYKTVFELDNGETITLEYRNSSNGYYGGTLERES